MYVWHIKGSRSLVSGSLISGSVIRKIVIKTTMEYHHLSTRMTKIKCYIERVKAPNSSDHAENWITLKLSIRK